MMRDLDGFHPILLQTLTTDCTRCQGLCCVALFRARSDGFPADLPAGTPCRHLLSDFRCGIHAKLAARGLRGCTGYDCLGAGQAVSESAPNWRESPATKEALFSHFYCTFALHQILWMLADAASLLPARPLAKPLAALTEENARLREHGAASQAEVAAHKQRVNGLLQEISARVQAAAGQGKRIRDCAGRDLRRMDLRGTDFSMALLIGARLDGRNLFGCNFLGADLRDASLCGADLRQSVFLTQMQLNTARVDQQTKLPAHLRLSG